MLYEISLVRLRLSLLFAFFCVVSATPSSHFSVHFNGVSVKGDRTVPSYTENQTVRSQNKKTPFIVSHSLFPFTISHYQIESSTLRDSKNTKKKKKNVIIFQTSRNIKRSTCSSLLFCAFITNFLASLNPILMWVLGF